MDTNDSNEIQQIRQEIATTRDGRDITRGFISSDFLIPPQDAILRSYHNYSVYDDVLNDDQVAACFQQRRSALISKEWEVQPSGPKRIDKYAAAAIQDMLTAIKFDDITDKMLYGVFYGFAVGECLWEQDDQFIILKDIKVRDRTRFAFDGDMRLRLLTAQAPNGELLPDKKFWTFSTGATHSDDPYGVGLAHWLYWPVNFKKNGIKFWLIFLEKFGMPTVKGIYEPNTTEEERSRLLEALSAVQVDSGIILPQGMQIELIEATRGGTADYSTLVDKMQGIISKICLSQTMTTDDGSSRAQASVHEGVAERVVKSDADLICGSFNRSVIRWLTDWNFPGAAYPKVWRILDISEDLNQRVTRDKTIFDMGFKPTLEYITNTYGGEWIDGSVPLPIEEPTQPALFAESTDKDEVDRRVDILAKLMEKPISQMWEPIENLVKNAKNYQEIQDGIEKLYDEIDASSFTLLFTQALSAARLAGQAKATEDLENA